MTTEPYTHLMCKLMTGTGSRRGNHSAAEWGGAVTHAGNRATYPTKYYGMVRGIESVCGKLRMGEVGEQDGGRGTAPVHGISAGIIGPVSCKKCIAILSTIPDPANIGATRRGPKVRREEEIERWSEHPDTSRPI